MFWYRYARQHFPYGGEKTFGRYPEWNAEGGEYPGKPGVVCIQVVIDGMEDTGLAGWGKPFKGRLYPLPDQFPDAVGRGKICLGEKAGFLVCQAGQFTQYIPQEFPMDICNTWFGFWWWQVHPINKLRPRALE